MSAVPNRGPDAQLLADADLCVKCGLCLPHCPTYLDTQHEGDSPRGRITLIQGLGSGLIAATSSMEAHLDGCLSCRRCEVVCPARVPYSRVLDKGRAQLAAWRPARTRWTRLLALMLVPRFGRGVLRMALAAYGALGIQTLVRRFGLMWRSPLARLESLLPARRSRASPPSPAGPSVLATGAPTLALFRGCATEVFEQNAIHATEILLRAAGYALHEVPRQTCCGALHQHGGMPERARELAQRNIAAYSGEEGIATLTTGCAATLRDYADIEPRGGATFAARVKDFADWLLPRADTLRFRPLPLRAALHTPCTALNVMKSDVALRALLARIPQLEIIELDPAQRCCGAAGSHFITHPAEADRLLAPKLDAVARLKPDFIISANIGCSLHLAAGLSRAGSASPPVRHPAQVLAAQLEPPQAQHPA